MIFLTIMGMISEVLTLVMYGVFGKSNRRSDDGELFVHLVRSSGYILGFLFILLVLCLVETNYMNEKINHEN